MLKNWLLKQAAAYYIEKAKAPEGKEALQLAGVDSDGRKYYTWPHLSQLPMIRRKRLETTAIFIDARISPENLKSLAESINTLNLQAANEPDAKKRSGIHAKISQLTVEISEREKYSVPEVTYLETAACIHVREDEPMNEWSEVIHQQKVDTFKAEMRKGNAFFFKTPIATQLLNSSIGIDENLTLLVAYWEAEESHLEQRRKAILSYSEFVNSTTTKMNG